MIDFTFTKEQETRYNSIGMFAKEQLNHHVVERNTAQIFSMEEWKKCGALKLQGLCVSEQYGGMGLDAVSTARALEALGYGCSDNGLNFSIGAHLLSCVVPIFLHGTDEQKNKYLPNLCNGNTIAANAITEIESGSNAFDLKTSAKKNKDGYIINGTKTFISNAPIANITVVYASTNAEKGFHGGISVFILENDISGITQSKSFDKMGLRTCPMGEINFKDVIANIDTMLGKEGAGSLIFLESMNWERILLSAIHIGTMHRVIEQSIKYATNRKLNNQAIGKNQIIAHRIADMHIKLEASRLMVYNAALQLDKKSKQVGICASATKLFVSEALNEVCLMAQTIFGASGYMTNNEIERDIRDALAAKTYSGTNDIQKNIIASALGL